MLRRALTTAGDLVGWMPKPGAQVWVPEEKPRVVGGTGWFLYFTPPCWCVVLVKQRDGQYWKRPFKLQELEPLKVRRRHKKVPVRKCIGCREPLRPSDEEDRCYRCLAMSARMYQKLRKLPVLEASVSSVVNPSEKGGG